MFRMLAATDYFAIVSKMILPRAKENDLVELSIDHALGRSTSDWSARL
jgi:hypothetical protein